MLFCEFLTVFVVEMYCNEFVKHTMVQIHSNCLRKAFTRLPIQIFSDTKFSQTFADLKVPDSYSIICDNFVSDSYSICDNFVSDSWSLV